MDPITGVHSTQPVGNIPLSNPPKSPTNGNQKRNAMLINIRS
jgi:hypothetical protein